MCIGCTIKRGLPCATALQLLAVPLTYTSTASVPHTAFLIPPCSLVSTLLHHWLCLQLLHIDLIIKRTLFFQHNNNKRIVKHQHHQHQHPLTCFHNKNNSTEIERQRERERAISLSRLLSREIELVLCINQPTNEQQQSSSLLD